MEVCQKTITTKSKIQSYTGTHIIQHWELECYLGFHSYSVTFRWPIFYDIQTIQGKQKINNEALKKYDTALDRFSAIL